MWKSPYSPPTVLVGVGAGIAAYKVVLAVREFKKLGWTVHVIPTPHSLNFVGEATWQELSENPAPTEVFSQQGPGHVELARSADLIVLAPATADLLARLRAGMADDLVTATVLASQAPVIAFPAMHTQMWLDPATQDNIATLRSRGWRIVDPDVGALSSGDTGLGRLPEPESIVQHSLALLESVEGEGELAGKRIVVTAGGTQEPIDPVRFVGNRSSGTMGIAIANEAFCKGAAVTLIAANVTAALPQEHERLTIVSAPTAQLMRERVFAALVDADALVMAAAVADFRPLATSEQKLKKENLIGPDPDVSLTMVLEATPDILHEVSNSPLRPTVLVGFGAETGDEESVLSLGAQKARRKNADILAVNRVGHDVGFGAVHNTLFYLLPDGTVCGQASGNKDELAKDLVRRVGSMLDERITS